MLQPFFYGAEEWRKLNCPAFFVNGADTHGYHEKVAKSREFVLVANLRIGTSLESARAPLAGDRDFLCSWRVIGGRRRVEREERAFLSRLRAK